MSYSLQAIVGTNLNRHATTLSAARTVTLPQGLEMIPLTDALYDELGRGGELTRFDRLSTGVVEWARRISSASGTPIAYIEAEFSGGTGGQSAIVWDGGATVLGPVHEEDAINQALRHLGVQVKHAHDEFAAVDLGKHRYTDDWVDGSV